MRLSVLAALFLVPPLASTTDVTAGPAPAPAPARAPVPSSATESPASKPRRNDDAVDEAFWTAGVITAGIQGFGFLAAYLLQTEAFYDVLGGVNSLALVVSSLAVGNGLNSDWRKIGLSTLFALSRFWLLAFLAWRAKDRGGDSRFTEVKPYFFKFLVVWILQGIWVFCVAMPMLFVNGIKNKVDLEPIDYAVIVVLGLALLIEILADVQKARWVKAGRAGGFCQVGLWAYSRHPNYFGEVLIWWCSWFLTISVWTADAELRIPGICSLLSPLVTTVLLLFVSGLPLAEGKGLARYQSMEGYQEYRDNTPILVPLIGYRCIPAIIKKTVLCEWSMYEYKPP
jgi:steroid 5-alpha reductase family enzyme